MTPTPAGWHPDPENPGQVRYWDGNAWTAHRAPSGPGLAGPPTQSNSKTVRILLAVLIGIFVLCGGGCFALLATSDSGDGPEEASPTPSVTSDQTDSPDGPAPSATLDPNLRGDQDHPVAVVPSRAFNIRGFEYQAGWSVTSNMFGLEINGVRVKNNRNTSDSAFVEFKFWRGQEVLASASCYSDDIAPGTTVSLDCGSTDKLPGTYDRLTINDSF